MSRCIAYRSTAHADFLMPCTGTAVEGSVFCPQHRGPATEILLGVRDFLNQQATKHPTEKTLTLLKAWMWTFARGEWGQIFQREPRGTALRP